jgi:energy-coupling factor transport system ATP-binding protein
VAQVKTPILSIADLSFRYPGTGAYGPGTGGAAGIPVLDGLGLGVPRVGRTVLFGKADAGKTTLARIIAGLVPRFTGGALSGTIVVNGSDTRQVPPFDLLQSVGLVAQDSDEQLLTTRCDTEVAFALESLGVPRDRMRVQVDESLRRAGLAGFEARNPATLSGGEKKRLLVACLDAISPVLWVLDEALGELDSEWKARVLGIIEEAGGTALFMESRWSSLTGSNCSTFHLLGQGRVTASAEDPRDVSFLASLADAGIRQGKPARRRSAAGKGSLLVQGLRFRFETTTGFELGIESLELRLGETCALVGKNGSGKSTLGKILCGLLPPKTGTISMGGSQGTRALRANDLRSTVGYLFQNPDHQIYLPSVREELSLGLRRQHMERREIDSRVEAAAAVFGLTDLSAPPALLSYGARRRLQAATFFLLSRDLLILDEIDTGLSYREVESLIDALAAQGPGIVLITHDMDLARASCDRILVMDEGRITGDAGPGRPESADVPGSTTVPR